MSDPNVDLARGLSIADKRAVEKAVDLYELEGALRCSVQDDMVLRTVEDRFLLRNGTCVAASFAAIEGSVLVGWLLSSPRTSGVGARWRRGARAVFLLRRDQRRVLVVSDESTALDVDGAAVEDGFATQALRFVAAHADPLPPPKAAPSAPPQNPWAMPDLLVGIDDEEATLPGYQRADASLAAS